MTNVRKVLGQVATGATTATVLYTVPAATSAVLSSVVIANRGTTVAYFRLSIRVAGAAADNKQYLYYDVIMPPNDTFIATIGVTLAATDELWGYASTANVTWQIFGEETS
jgi:hypothetical protein